MTRPIWPTDTRFRRIAAAIADAVTVALASGERVGGADACRCPMGCISDANRGRPVLTQMSLVQFGLTHQEFCDFIEGFDFPHNNWSDTGPFAELGREYRRRFP